jgi:crotonobetainyl-CoA:carnitine CoA-transferase CaiB-like acyl-CoA transferase
MARRVFEAIGRADLIEDPRFSTNAARLAHDHEVEAMLRGFFGAMDREAALALFRARGVTVGPIHDATSLLRDPHVAARGVYVEEDSAGTVMHAVTPRLSGTPGGLRRAAPRCGEHSAEILGELGAEAAEVAALTAKRAIRCG